MPFVVYTKMDARCGKMTTVIKTRSCSLWQWCCTMCFIVYFVITGCVVVRRRSVSVCLCACVLFWYVGLWYVRLWTLVFDTNEWMTELNSQHLRPSTCCLEQKFGEKCADFEERNSIWAQRRTWVVAHCGPTPMTCGSCSCHEHITNSVIWVSRPPVLDCGTTFHLDSGGRDLPSTPSHNLRKIIYLATEALSDSFECTGAM